MRLLWRHFSFFRVDSFNNTFIRLRNINIRVVRRLIINDGRSRVVQPNGMYRVEETQVRSVLTRDGLVI